MQELEGKVAVVTGGASGIGLAMGTRFAQAGMKVLLADIEAGALDDAAAPLRAAGHDVRTEVCDVSDADDMDDLGDAVIETFGAVHVVCNNAGVSGGGLLQDITVKDWQWILGVNLWGVIHGVRVFLPKLLEQGEGHIVNTGSVLGLHTAPFTGPYAVSKFGVVSLSEVLFHELSLQATDVGVSVLCPGWVSTNLYAADRNRPEQLRDAPTSTDPDNPTAEPAISEVLKGVMAAGIDPAEVAERVLAAVQTKQFYVLTHDESAVAVQARMDAIIGGTDPAFSMPS